MSRYRCCVPKPIKLAAQKDERPLHRGPRKKKDRKKGVKARSDELKAGLKHLIDYARWVLQARQQERIGTWRTVCERRFKDAWEKQWVLINAAVKDGVISDNERLNFAYKLCPFTCWHDDPSWCGDYVHGRP